MKIAVVSAFYSEGMGYTENCLPKALAEAGHDVHLVTSVYNVYGNSGDYARTYQAFLGAEKNAPGTTQIDGYTVHRLPAKLLFGYVKITGLTRIIRKLRPEIVHSTAIASLDTYELALVRPLMRFRFFAETHQHLSVIRPYMRDGAGNTVRRAIYRLTRTLPTSLASRSIERCYAISPDCAQVASQFYGVPASKVSIESLGTDTSLFCPATSESAVAGAQWRADHGFAADDIICVYTGRFSAAKNPLLLADAVATLAARGYPYKALFIGEGEQRDAIAARPGCTLVPFVRRRELAEYYRAADIAVWPTQESMSMLDAAASGLPLVFSNRMGEADRVDGNGKTYIENDLESLQDALLSLREASVRRRMGHLGRQKMVERFSWTALASRLIDDFRRPAATATA